MKQKNSIQRLAEIIAIKTIESYLRKYKLILKIFSGVKKDVLSHQLYLYRVDEKEKVKTPLIFFMATSLELQHTV